MSHDDDHAEGPNWDLIESARADAGGDPDRQAELVALRLSARPTGEIIAFARWVRTKMLEANRADLLLAAEWICAANGLPEVSGDGWEYFRGWLVAHGRGAYEPALADADVIREGFTSWDEFLSGEEIELAANQAYELATGLRDVPDETREPWLIETWPADEG